MPVVPVCLCLKGSAEGLLAEMQADKAAGASSALLNAMLPAAAIRSMQEARLKADGVVASIAYAFPSVHIFQVRIWRARAWRSFRPKTLMPFYYWLACSRLRAFTFSLSPAPGGPCRAIWSASPSWGRKSPPKTCWPCSTSCSLCEAICFLILCCPPRHSISLFIYSSFTLTHPRQLRLVAAFRLRCGRASRDQD